LYYFLHNRLSRPRNWTTPINYDIIIISLKEIKLSKEGVYLMKKTGQNNNFKSAAILLCITLVLSLFISMTGCMGGGEQASPTPAENTETNETGSTGETGETGEPDISSANLEWNLEELMSLADEYGETEEEKYGNKILVASSITGLIIVNYYENYWAILPETKVEIDTDEVNIETSEGEVNVDSSEGSVNIDSNSINIDTPGVNIDLNNGGININTPDGGVEIDTEKEGTKVNVDTDEKIIIEKQGSVDRLIGIAFAEPEEEETGEEVIITEIKVDLSEEEIAKFKENSGKNITELQEIKKALESVTVPAGYEEIHENVLACYDKLIEGIKEANENVGKDSESLKASDKIIDDGRMLMEKAMEGLNQKGYEQPDKLIEVIDEKMTVKKEN